MTALLAAAVVLCALAPAPRAAMTRPAARAPRPDGRSAAPGPRPVARSAAVARRPHVFAFLSHAAGGELADLARVGRAIGVLAPNWYSLDLGTGAVRGPSGTAAVLREARQVHVPVWPVVNARASHAVSLGDRSVARRAARAIARVGTAPGYAGATLDIEGLKASERAPFSSLVAHVAATLHRHGRRLAVYAPGADGVGSGAAYDWSSLASSADLLLVSTYARGVGSATRGPASSSASFRAAVTRAEAVSGRKVAPTLEAVGYSWPAGRGRARIVSAAAAARRRAGCQAANGATRTDAAAYTCHGRHVYYPTARALRAQARIARNHGIRWVGLFSLGREPAAFWKGSLTAR